MRRVIWMIDGIDRKILELLRLHGQCSRDQLRDMTGIPRSTIYDRLIRLRDQGRVKRIIYNNHQRGRPLSYWALSKERIIKMNGKYLPLAHRGKMYGKAEFKALMYPWEGGDL
jgi:DNA-binding Lrp family transcriptional regulator